jgi:hypothetical protein
MAAAEGTRVFVPDATAVWRPATVLSVREAEEGDAGGRVFTVQHEPLGAHPSDPESSR